MGDIGTVIHYNGSLAHQITLARVLADGFKRHGLECHATTDIDAEADIHVVIGPWYAYNRWKDYPRTLYIDRAYWGDPTHVSIHRLRNGEKTWREPEELRYVPGAMPYKYGNRVLYLCDFRKQPEGKYDTVRYHPMERKSGTTLMYDLANHDIAVGGRSTAMVDAVLQGLMVFTNDIHSPVHPLSGKRDPELRDVFLQVLAGHNWSHTDIQSGEFLNALGIHPAVSA